MREEISNSSLGGAVQPSKWTPDEIRAINGHYISPAKMKVVCEDFVADPSDRNYDKMCGLLYNNLRKYSYGITNDEDGAVDVTLNTFERFRNNVRMYDSVKGNVVGFVYRICRNLSINWLRAQQRKPNMVSIREIRNYEPKPGEETSFYTPLPTYTESCNYVSENGASVDGETFDDREVINRLADISVRIMEGMDSNMRYVLTEKLLNGKKLWEIAEDMNLNISTVKNILYRGKDMLLNTIQNDYPEYVAMYQDILNQRQTNDTNYVNV